MNILQLEQERTTLKEKLTTHYSAQARLLFLSFFFEEVLSFEDKNINDSFLPEFLPEYVYCLKNFSGFGLKPRIHELVIEQAEKIVNNGLTTGYDGFSEAIKKLKNEFEKLQRILEGKCMEAIESKAFFPLLEEEAIKETGITIGVLETVTIKINRTKTSDKFIIVPSEKEIEERINEQVKLSWLNAVRIVKKYIKRIHPYHEVIISFDKKAGFCKGNSLGTSLTLAFIEEILKNYISPVAIKVGGGIAFTGGIDEKGKITNTSEEIIKQKTELVFFSNINLFVIPKEEETAANEKLNELKKEFPKRDLKTIGIEDISDLLDRRTIVEIKKQPVIVRGGKFLKKNWAAVSIILILTTVISFFVIRDIDTNPVSFTADGNKIYIKNKSGKVLWEKKAFLDNFQLQSNSNLKSVLKIVDVNFDGMNEVLITNEIKEAEKPEHEFAWISCYNYKGEIIWRYSFKDQIASQRELLPSAYGITIIDTATFNGEESLFLFANNSPSFSSAIFRLNLKTGKRLPGTIWCSGHTNNSLLKDVTGDGVKDIIGVGVDNGHEDAVFFAVEFDTLTRVRPTTEEYLIKNFPMAEMAAYIRLPKTDFDIYMNYRTPGINPNSFYDNMAQKHFRFTTYSYISDNASVLWYEVDYNFRNIDIVVDSRFRVMRDSLVARGKLPLPYTDTTEFVNMQKSKILYWKKGKWVKLEELE